MIEFTAGQTTYRIRLDGIEWGFLGWIDTHPHYFYWWNWLGFEHVEGVPMVGIHRLWYDGPHVVIRAGPFSMCWSTPWTRGDVDE